MSLKSRQRLSGALLLAVCVVAVQSAGDAQTTAGSGGAKSEGAPAAPEKKGAPAPQTIPTPAVSAQAEQMLRDMSDYLKAAQQLSVHADISYDDLLPPGQKIQLAAAYDAAVRRPDRFYTEYGATRVPDAYGTMARPSRFTTPLSACTPASRRNPPSTRPSSISSRSSGSPRR